MLNVAAIFQAHVTLPIIYNETKVISFYRNYAQTRNGKLAMLTLLAVQVLDTEKQRKGLR